ncbi:MAG TPA: DUF4352 domain-containing protein, partial [Solirubrobacteraceae bacterium]|nr:DUF4352 domain-containing protein [Solirubrobacteraceae bacterium]
DANTPRVGPRVSVEVAHLRWRLVRVSVKTAIGEPTSGLRTKAKGIYVVVTLRVTNNGSESISLSEDLVSIVTKSSDYFVDSRATQALLGEGHPALLIEDVSRGLSLTGEIAFDIAPSGLSQKPSLRFAEPNLGSVYGYIALPRLAEHAESASGDYGLQPIADEGEPRLDERGEGGFNRCSQRFAFGGIVDARRALRRVCASRASCVVCC